MTCSLVNVQSCGIAGSQITKITKPERERGGEKKAPNIGRNKYELTCALIILQTSNLTVNIRVEGPGEIKRDLPYDSAPPFLGVHVNALSQHSRGIPKRTFKFIAAGFTIDRD